MLKQNTARPRHATPRPRPRARRQPADARRAPASTRLGPLALAAALAPVILAAATLRAAPEGGQTVHGGANIERAGHETTITTSTTNTILRFDSFDLAADESVRFVQPDAGARVLNKIAGSAPSRIDGSIWSNGTVYLVNPAGVMFGPDAVIDVAAFYAGAANLANDDFLHGVDRFDATGSLVNAGTINADRVALVGRRVANLGAIHAPDGMVALAAGENVMLSDRDRRIYIRIEGAQPDAQAPPAGPDADAELDDAAITNRGTIDAEGGAVSWGAGDIYAMGLRQTEAGSVRADRFHAEAGPDAVADLDGVIDVSNPDGPGGHAALTAGRLEVRGEINASGSTGGGRVHLGGGPRGDTDLPHAQTVRVHHDARLLANAHASGDGGEIVAYAERFTAFAGAAEATGGPLGGDGGFVEASAHDLVFRGAVDLSAVDGSTGELLFDPTNITIVDGGPGADDDELPDLSDADVGAGDFVIAEQALELLAANASLILEATNNITIEDIDDDQIALPITSDGAVALTADLDGDGAGSIVFNDTADELLTEGGDVQLVAADLTLGSINTRGLAGNVDGGAISIQTSAANTILALGDDPGGNRLHLDGLELDGLFADALSLHADANVLIDNVPLNATDSTPLLDITSAAGDIRVLNNPSTINSELTAVANVGDIDLLVPLTVDADASFTATDGDISLTDNALIAPGLTVALVADADNSAGGTIQANAFDPGHVEADRVELTSGSAIGAAGNPVELLNAAQIVLDANQSVFVEGDGATSPTLFSLAVDPAGAFLYRFDELPDESISGDDNAIVRDANGDLFINSVEAAPATSTSYAFTAKTGDLFVDDTLGDGGVFTGDGDAALVAQAGSVLPETPRPAFNVRTNPLPDGPNVTLRALNDQGAGPHEASVGGDGADDNFLDVEGAANLTIDARDHANVRGSGQTLTRLDLLLDPDAPGIDPDAPTYQLLDVDSGDGDGDDADFAFDIASDDTDLFVNDLSTETDADLQVTAYTGHLDVARMRSAGGDLEATTVQQTGDRGDIIVDADAMASAGGTIVLRASAVSDGGGGLAPPPGAAGVGDGDIRLAPNAVDAADGPVGLFAGGGVDETDPDDSLQLVNVATGDQLFIRANGDVGGDESVGDATNLTESHLDIDAAALNAVALGNGVIVIKDHTPNPDGLTVEAAVVNDNNAFVRVDSVGTMTVEDGAVFAPENFVWLASEADIAEPAGDSPDTANASTNGNVRFDAEGDVGGDADPFDIAADGLFALVGQGAFGGTEGAAGGVFVNNLVDTPDTTLTVFQLHVFDGDVAVETGNDMVFDGAPFFSPNRDPQFEPFEMDNPGDITLTAPNGIITLQNADLDDPVGFDNAADVLFDGPVVVALNQQFAQQATTGLLQAQTVAFNQSLTTEIPFEIDATGDVDVVGAIVFGAQAVIAGDALDFQAPVTLGGDTNIDGQTITFNDTIASDDAGDHSLSLDTSGDGLTELFGEIGNGGANPLFVITTNADGTTRLHADVFTRGRQAYFDHLELADNVTLTDAASTDPQGGPDAALSGSGVFFATVGSDGTPRNLAVVTETDPDDLTDLSPRVSLIGFGGDVGVDPDGAATAGARLNNLLLNPDGNRPDAPALASIVAGQRESEDQTNVVDDDAFAFDVHVDNAFEMGRNEKMTVLGDATFNLNLAGNGPGAVVGRLSDVNAGGALTVDANGADVVLLDHDPAPLGLLRPEDRNANDALDEFFEGRGLDFWARDAIAFNNVNDLSLDGAGTVEFLATDRGDITGVGAFPRSNASPFPPLTRPFGTVDVVLDPAPLRFFDLSEQLPPPSPPVTDSVRAPLTTRAFMDALNLATRDGAPAEQLGRALGATTIDDMGWMPGAPTEFGAADPGSPGTASLARVRESAVPGVLEAYRRTFYTPAEAGADGEEAWRPRFDELREALAEGVAAYRAEAGEAPNDPVGFRGHLAANDAAPAALAVLDALESLYLKMYQLGLTERQWSRLLFRLTEPITPAGVSTDLVIQAALGQGG